MIGDMITDLGFNLETHKILTDDQYILTAWRIYKSNTKKFKHPMYIFKIIL